MKVALINLMTLSRILLAIVIFLLLAIDDYLQVALILFMLAGFTDYLDGYLARKYSLTSKLGEILDPVADKILIIFCVIGLALNLSSYLIGFVGAFIITREIWVSALRDFNSRNNNSDATKVIFLAKVKTSVQLFTIAIYLFAIAFDFMLLVIIGDVFLILALLITLYTGFLYTIQSLEN